MQNALTRTTVENALFLLEPMILKVSQEFKCPNFHIVVGDPGIKPGDVTEEDWLKKGILFEKSYGDKATWAHPYDEYARSKCRVSWRTGLSNLTVIRDFVDFLLPGDCLFYGAVARHGMFAATSGFSEAMDQATSSALLDMTHALTQASVDSQRKAGVAFLK